MHSTHLRHEHIHGLLLGVAIGEALGYARDGLPRHVALRMFGRPPLRYRFIPACGIYGENTRLTLLNAQALLNSRGEQRGLQRAFLWRIMWYPLSFPSRASGPIVAASLRSWVRRLGVAPGTQSTRSSAATRAIFSALAMHGTGHRLVRWTEESTKLTHVHPLAIDGCRVLAALANAAVANKSDEADSQSMLAVGLGVSTQAEISDKLSQLTEFLEQRRSPSFVARHFGWKSGVPDGAVPMTIMATYCWLRYPKNFRRAVESGISLGGASATLGAIVGGLAGAHSGAAGIPEELRQRLNGTPHNAKWIEGLAERFSHWPHGVDDLHLAPAQSSDPLLQIVRNVLMHPISLFHAAWRLPYRITVRTPRNHNLSE